MADEITNINNEQEKPIIQKAEELAQRIEEANKKAEEILKRQTEIYTRELLGGKSLGGAAQVKEETEEEKWRREAKIRYKGTGLDPT